MKKTGLYLLLATCAASVSAESIIQPVNDQIPGTISGRIQTIGMYRDFEGSGNGANASAGLVLEYTSPEMAGFDFGLAYNFADEMYEKNDDTLMANEDINVLNEAWARYRFSACELTNTTLTVGRKITNGEVFRTDDYRQKARSIESVQFYTADLAEVRVTVGHADKLSNWPQVGELADFNNFGEVFNGTGADDTDGISWVEAGYDGIEDLELALFDAYAWDVVNLVGLRLKWSMTDESALLGYLRHENDVGSAAARESNAFGLSLQQKVGAVMVEPGLFSVHGDTLRFQETTTGINHALGLSMLIYGGQFNGGADTLYLKATTKINDTALYALYNYTWQSKESYDGQELNFVIKQPLADNLTVTFKGGVGYRDREGSADTTATDGRIFLTYVF
jgi:opacity protein-like surface antigen